MLVLKIPNSLVFDMFWHVSNQLSCQMSRLEAPPRCVPPQSEGRAPGGVVPSDAIDQWPGPGALWLTWGWPPTKVPMIKKCLGTKCPCQKESVTSFFYSKYQIWGGIYWRLKDVDEFLNSVLHTSILPCLVSFQASKAISTKPKHRILQAFNWP